MSAPSPTSSDRSSARAEQHKAALHESRAYLDQILDQVGDGWDTQVYSHGAAWTVRQLLVHLAISDRGLNNQIMGIAEGREVIPADFDLERYNRRSVEKQTEMTIEAARASLNTSRAEILAWLDHVDDAALDRVGRHASMQMLSADEILHQLADHERNHAQDIARTLGLPLS